MCVKANESALNRLQAMNAKRVGLMGGTFDPIHKGHIVMCEAALAEFDLDAILIVPAGHPAHKQGKRITDKEDRYEMIRLAIQGEQRMFISRFELDAQGINYAVDTLHMLHEKLPAIVWFYIIGSDTLWTLDQWKEYMDVLELCYFIDFLRDGRTKEEDLAIIDEKYKPWKDRFFIATMRPPNISSTVFSKEKRGEMLPPPVQCYIDEHRLYR